MDCSQTRFTPVGLRTRVSSTRASIRAVAAEYGEDRDSLIVLPIDFPQWLINVNTARLLRRILLGYVWPVITTRTRRRW